MNKSNFNNEESFLKKINDLSSKSYDDVLAFLKSSSCYNYHGNCKYAYLFWQSELPLKYFKKLSDGNFYNELLLGYFSSPKNANSDFLKLATTFNESVLIEVIKLSKAFEMKEHWETFEIFKYHEKTLFREFYRELEFIKNLLQHWEEKANYYNTIIKLYDYEDILIHIISYFEKFKRSSQKHINNRSYITSVEAHLINVTNQILYIKKVDYQKSKKIPNSKYSITDFNNKLEDTLPPLNPPEGIIKKRYLPVEKIDDEKKLIREAIDFFFAFDAMYFQIEKYLGGYADFEYIQNLHAGLLTNEAFALFKKNDIKVSFEEFFFHNKSYEFFENKFETNLQQNDLRITYQIVKALEYFKYLKLPIQFKSKHNGKIDMEKVFKLLIIFSNYLMPFGRIFLVERKATSNGIEFRVKEQLIHQKPVRFSNYFKDNYMVGFERQDLIAKCKKYFGWEEQEVINIIDFLTTDLTANRAFKIDLMLRPILKVGNNYYWLSSLLRDRRWEILMHRRLVSDKINKHVEQSAKIENQLALTFKKAGFNAVSSYYYNGGEIDVLIYKDNTLFVIELKTSYAVEDLLRNKKYQIRKFHYKAHEQLKRNVAYIKQNFEEIKKIEDLNIDCEIDNLKIIPLIVSNVYSGDDIFFGNKILKISMFELMIILHNDLYDMLNFGYGLKHKGKKFVLPTPLFFQFQNSNSFNIKKKFIKTDKETLNLWKNKRNCSVEDLLDAIREDKVWNFLDELYHFEPEKILLHHFEPKNKYLI